VNIFVFDIQRYSIHDGPGIRTTVFLKGCNMRCAWCENPESISSAPQISFAEERCIGCKSCEAACPLGAISTDSGYPIDKTRCDLCGACVAACPTNALNLIGKWRDVDDLVSELLLDRDYWSESGGGVTISGGEAALQLDALCELLAALNSQGIHTVLQTNGNISWEKLELIARDVDLFHFDLKGIKDASHRTNTGVGNERILANARRLSEGGYPVVFRVPLIPGYNDSPKDLLRLKDFLDSIKARFIDVLPYHNLGERKLDLTGMEGGKLLLPSMNRTEAMEKARILEGEGRVVMVSGERVFPEYNSLTMDHKIII
jgi:pyruvate formate lyase activating enzyme